VIPSSENEPTPSDPAPRSPLPVNLASLIDHTLLKPEVTRSDIERLCSEGLQHGFAAVCVDGSWVELCARLLSGSKVKVATVAGFPHGAMTSGAKANQTAELVGLGADEIDMVASIGRIIDGDWDYVEDDIAGVVDAADGKLVKVILETAVLSPTRIVEACAIAMHAGAHYVKTSTGFHPAGGATEDAVALMHAAVGNKLGVKAAGGIRDREPALRMVAAGATRIGTSKGVEIVHSS
jgi:deoxyribose-phosphate aldolase